MIGKYLVIILCCCLMGLSSIIHAAQAQKDITGYWKVYDQENDASGGPVKAIMHISIQDDILQGVGVRLYSGDWPKLGRYCTQCGGNLHNKSVWGLKVVSGLKQKGDYWKGGTVVDPTRGQADRIMLSLEDEDTIRVRGYMLIPLFGETIFWHRVSKEEAYEGCQIIASTVAELAKQITEEQAIILGNQGLLCYTPDKF